MNHQTINGGLFSSLRGLMATAVGLARTRLELLATELEEEKLRLLAILLYGAVALFLLGVGLVLAVIFVAMLLWDSHRLLAMGGITAIFFLGGFFSLSLALRNVRSGSRLFAASLAELVQDRHALQGKPTEESS